MRELERTAIQSIERTEFQRKLIALERSEAVWRVEWEAISKIAKSLQEENKRLKQENELLFQANETYQGKELKNE
jgi:hypothetical protein